ncbi:glycosyl hydrolase 115 family protein [candidate division WOR-3 bacterium]|nr:glycosyl hydrolase 115 family protein [candidate division WOR-3 bacterium]
MNIKYNISENNCRFRKLFYFILLFLIIITSCSAAKKSIDYTSYISVNKGEGRFILSSSGKSAPLYVSSEDYPGVIKVAKLFQADIERVTDSKPEIFVDEVPKSKEIVIIGTIGKSKIIDKLVTNKKIDVEDTKGKWETFTRQVVENPLPGITRALVIVGSDKRGTIYGMFDLSEKIGVSPWYYWADVPVKKNRNLYVSPEPYSLGEPAVKYRGIFINDEAPALTGWAFEKFGGFNSKFYKKVFELILRLKGNYLWPAMWGRAFYVDDTLNPKLADEYGIVIGTSHHEPLMRAHDEWRRFGSGRWNYELNEASLKEFWREGIQRMDGYESIVTIGMRGDGDEPMTEGTAIALLERIVKDQREIIEEVTGKPASATPQDWALYKEVQDYYDGGMRVPDDVTLLLCDDNWGNVRRLPKLSDSPRSGGYGMYYHFDFVGGPRSYRWLNTNQISRIWEQMHLSYAYGVEEIWIVNVGDIKPMEFPTQFFLDYAWNLEKWPAERLPEYTKLWTKQQFGEKYADEIADILTKYTKYNSRRKPESIDSSTYNLTDYREAERVIADYNQIAFEAENIYQELPSEFKDAYYQLVLFPVKACANINEMHVTVGKNYLYAKQGRAATNMLAEKVKKLFTLDAELTEYYHTKMANGKWNHMMSQSHIGYTSWDNPPQNIMPPVKEIKIPSKAEMGVAIEGSDKWWPDTPGQAVLPEFDCYNQQKYYIEIFNRGTLPFDFKISCEEPWIIISDKEGKIDKEKRIYLEINWEKAPKGIYCAPIEIKSSNNKTVTIKAPISNTEYPKRDEIKGFVESNGYVSMEAEHYTRAVESNNISWLTIPDFGRTLSGITPVPVTAKKQTTGGNSPHLEYKMYLFNSGKVKVKAYFSPTQNFHNKEGLHYGISFDDETAKIMNVHKNDTIPDWKYPPTWNQAVMENIKIISSEHLIENPGEHTLKFWMIDPGLVLQKIVVETKEIPASYLGPPESFHK